MMAQHKKMNVLFAAMKNNDMVSPSPALFFHKFRCGCLSCRTMAVKSEVLNSNENTDLQLNTVYQQIGKNDGAIL